MTFEFMSFTPPSPSPRPVALITGASGGIGEEFARLLAREGFDLILVARSRDKLTALADELVRQSGGRCHVLPADLTQSAAAAHVVEQLRERALEIDVLVNNAGFGTYGPFVDSEPASQRQMTDLNVAALTDLTRLLLPGMIARGKARILNVASTAAFQPGPLMAVYYATKAYVLSFSEALADELRNTGVTVTCLCPGPTVSGFQDRAAMQQSRLVRRFKLMDGATVARAGYAAMMRGKRLVIPGLANRLLVWSVRFSPRAWVTRIVRYLMEPVPG